MKINELLINGGMAHKDGVSFYGKNYQSRAKRKKNGEIEVVVNNLKPLPEWLHNMLGIPLLRGFADSIYAFYMKWYIGAFFILAPLLMNYRFELIKEKLTTESDVDLFGFASGMAIGVIFIILLLNITPFGKYHGAEHVMHNLYLQGRRLTIEEGKKTTRIHEWCGSSWYILLLIYTLIMLFIPIPLWLKIAIWFPFYGEVLMNENQLVRTILMPFKWAGYALQLLTTSKPKEVHLEVSLHAFQSLLEKEETLLKKKQA